LSYRRNYCEQRIYCGKVPFDTLRSMLSSFYEFPMQRD